MLARRRLLAVRDNPARGSDYLVRLDVAISPAAIGPVAVALTYVPDRTILERGAFAAYLDALAAQDWSAIEEMGAAALADIESELVPRYLGIALRESGDRADGHAALFEGRQPGWNNDALLARLG